MAPILTFPAFAWKNLWRRRLRTTLTLGGIAMAIAAFVGLVGFSRSFENAWLLVYRSAGTDLAVVQQTFLNTSVSESVGAKLSALPDVSRATPMIINLMALTPEVNALAYGWKSDSYEFEGLQMMAGRRFHDGQPEVILGDFLAETLHKRSGDTLEIEGAPFTVTGIYHGGSALEAGAIILPLDQMQRLGSNPGTVTAFHVRLRPAPAGIQPDEYVHRVQAQIEAALPGLRAVPAAERASNNQLVLLARAAAWGTSAIALLIGIFGIANTMAMSVFERTQEIGLLRALGWKRHRILALIQLEAAVMGLTGGFLGIVAGWCALRLLALFPKTASIASTSIPPLLLPQALCIAVMAGLLAGAVPAWRGTRLTPMEALRDE